MQKRFGDLFVEAEPLLLTAYPVTVEHLISGPYISDSIGNEKFVSRGGSMGRG